MPPEAFHAAHAQSVRYLDRLARAIDHLDAHLADPLDGQVLAAAAAMSRYHFQRLFTAYFGTTVAGYVTWRRLRRACQLLVASPMPVRDVAFEVGYGSAQALAKAMRRELDLTPLALRAGQAPRWQQVFDRRCAAAATAATTAGADRRDRGLRPRISHVRALPILTATARGMHRGDMRPAAEQAFDELVPAIRAADLLPRVRSWLALFPDEPQGLDDQQARMVCGAVFDRSMTEPVDGPPDDGPVGAGEPAVTLTGSLGWVRLPAGRYAVFTHVGPHALLHAVWRSIYRHWLPATGYGLRDVPCFERYVDDPRAPLGGHWRTELYLPLV